ncbi:hypothetical protein QQS21_011151 [Conoideocrella luteorostrata]|uniref:FAD-binding domain-containing protein n=1 Tax=Conoideocrella luteorostrata TaxID=1105319 RepID=A0AAJ0CGC9_9HYPO|nr:hypothetical protein QQS21_011151 [Conoideocrella luteorostrata]
MLNVIIVGAGISGLTCSIALMKYTNVKVTIFERTMAMEKVGNGIQIPCNAAHAMRCLGLLDRLLAQSKRPATSFKTVRYSGGETLLDMDFDRCNELYGAPWLLMHRADYMSILLVEARRLGVQINLGCEVQHVEFDTPSVTLADGQVHEAHVIVSCDGVNSMTRSLIHPSIRAASTGEYAYRALLTRSQLSSSSSFNHIISTPSVLRCWLGPNANAILYPLQDGMIFNLVIPIADVTFNTFCNGKTNLLHHVRDWLRDWDPVLLEMLDVAGELVRFPMYQVRALPHWTKGAVTLMGDAAHAMLPHLAQGAATGVEDGYILGTLLGLLAQHTTGSPDDSILKRKIKTVLQSYEHLQHERTSRVVSNSRLTGTLDHLPDGPDQRARDAEFGLHRTDESVSAMPWIDARWNRELLGRKVDEVTEREFHRLVAEGQL